MRTFKHTTLAALAHGLPVYDSDAIHLSRVGFPELLEVCDRLLDGVWSLALPHPASLSADRVTVSLGYAVLGAAEWIGGGV